jgi:hypothetical protein
LFVVLDPVKLVEVPAKTVKAFLQFVLAIKQGALLALHVTVFKGLFNGGFHNISELAGCWAGAIWGLVPVSWGGMPPVFRNLKGGFIKNAHNPPPKEGNEVIWLAVEACP